jgi:uncharacterized membrane protein YeaQ/YmgE (transglycosylase-associated protein family)
MTGGESFAMTVLEIIILLAIAAIAGSLGQAIAGYSLGGCLVSIIVGFIGAYLGYWLAGALGLPPILTVYVGDEPFPFVWAVIGSALFALVLGLLTRRRVTRSL